MKEHKNKSNTNENYTYMEDLVKLKLNHSRKHAERLHQKQTKLKHKMDIANVNYIPVTEGHRLHKKSPISCGKPHCLLCGNPRKTMKQKTIQEKSFNQKKLYDDSDR